MRQRGQVEDCGGGVFRIRVPLGTRPDGRRPYHNETLRGSTPAKAQKRLNAILAEVDAGAYFSPSKRTVGEMLDEFMERRRRSDVRPSTLDTYKAILDTHIRPALGALRLSALTADRVQKFYDDLQDAGLAGSTVRYVHARLKCACKRAVKLKWLSANPCEEVELPPSGDPKKARPFDRDEALRFIEECRKSRADLIFVFALATGLRPSEFVGVDYPHLSVAVENGRTRGLLQVEQAVTHGRHGGWYLAKPKTRSGRRPVYFPVALYYDLVEGKEAHLEHLRRLGHKHQLIFTNSNGNPVRRCQLTRRFLKACERAGIPTEGCSLYTLRRSHGSLALLAGEDVKALSERMGHKKVEFTLNEYTDVLPELRRVNSDKFENLLFGTNVAQTESDRTM